MLRSVALTFLLCLVVMSWTGLQNVASGQDDDAAVADAAADVAVVEEMVETEEEAAVPTNAELSYAIDNLILFISAVLVLFMQAGFAMVETGFNASKNAVNILFKNLMDMCIGVLLFWFVGYGIMYPGEFNIIPGFLGFPTDSGFPKFGVSETAESAAPGALYAQVDWLFQVAFAATAATIVSGAVAGRMRFGSYLVYSAVITGLIYPLTGSWQWGHGWLYQMGFADFAGSIVVHAVGGFAGLAGAIVLGPRIGRYAADGTSKPMLGHNMPLATLGVFILWIGWYGFNPGSQLAFSGEANTNATLLIAANTTLAAAAGGFAAMLLSWVMFKKPDLSMALNGVLAGLVGITANCDCVTNLESMAIGAIAGVLVLLSILALDKLRIDDPVGAFPVHGVCGVWGGVATGIFGADKDLGVQILGSAVIPAVAFFSMLIVFLFLKGIGVLRVSPAEEEEGLDLGEHGIPAYGM